jgi:uncharacterized membrane protein
MKWRGIAIAIIAFFGMVDALFLTMKRGAGPVPCNITSGCNDVLTSSYSELAGIPISWFGLFFYLIVFSCAVFALYGAPQALLWIFWPASAAFVVSALLTGIQAFTLNAYCEYCLASAAMSTSIFLLAPSPRWRRHPE